jgi:hypothetical protein
VRSPTRLARLAGVLYLLMCILGVFAHLNVRAGIHAPGDAAATAAGIVANATLFRASLVADMIMATLFVFLGLVLHRLLRQTDRTAAGAMVTFVVVGAAMILVNLLFHHAALLVATDPTYAAAFGAEGADALALLLLDLHHDGYTIAGIFFGLWLLPLGYLAVRSGMFPRLLGVAVAVAGLSFVVDTLVRFAAPDLPAAVHAALTAPQFAEIAMILYLLIRGVRTPRRPDPAVAPLDEAHTIPEQARA